MYRSSFRLDRLLINVVIALEIAIEAFEELSDTAVAFIEDTLVLQEKGTRLDQLCSLNFIYFMFVFNRFIDINCSEVISSDKFILYKYIFRSSLDINITYNNIVVRDLFLKSVLGSIIEVRYKSETRLHSLSLHDFKKLLE